MSAELLALAGAAAAADGPLPIGDLVGAAILAYLGYEALSGLFSPQPDSKAEPQLDPTLTTSYYGVTVIGPGVEVPNIIDSTVIPMTAPDVLSSMMPLQLVQASPDISLSSTSTNFSDDDQSQFVIDNMQYTIAKSMELLDIQLLKEGEL